MPLQAAAAESGFAGPLAAPPRGMAKRTQCAQPGGYSISTVWFMLV